jgi:low affinity Fe/Cu permease
MIRQDERMNTNGKDATATAKKSMRDAFHVIAQRTAGAVGTPWAFTVALVAIIVWAALGPVYNYSDTWQLIINTATTIITFLMVFLIQNTQNRDARAIHLKLDELIRGIKGARNYLVDLENCTDEELDQLEKEFHRIRQRARHGQGSPHHEATAAKAQDHVQAIADRPGRSDEV